MKATISYGKGQVTLYRTYAQPLQGIPAIPESAFTGRRNILFALDVDVVVFGHNFLPAYTDGDNSQVVATDTMKNFILQQALTFQGATLEAFLIYLGHGFLATYPQMHALRLTGREQPFMPARIPQDQGGGFTESEVLFQRSHDDYSVATIDVTRGPDHIQITSHRCGHAGMQLIKVTGSSFASFVRDSYTTLPERVDRPLFIYLDVYWKYEDTAPLAAADLPGYVPGEQVRDLVHAVFHRFVSMSIQHLVNEMGACLLARFPQLAEVSFDAQNRLWDTFATSQTDAQLKVYGDPRPPYGMIHLTLNRDDHTPGDKT